MATKLTTEELEKIRNLIQQFDFKALFNQLGWSNPLDNRAITKTVNTQELTYQQIAQLSGVVVLQVATSLRSVPDGKTRLALHEKISQHEHLLIFVDSEKTQCCWSWLKRDGKKTLPRSHNYFKGQSSDLLLSKIINMMVDFQDFDENGHIPVVDVTMRMNASFNANAEKTTKKFYDEFKKRHKEFMSFINGLENEEDKRWYASLMLNRLMFIYFIQKKGFLDNDFDYLQNKLKQIQATQGDNKFYSFYRDFLLVFFHQGLGSESREDKELIKLIGKVPYLNGGLFDIHELEKEQQNPIQISDEAFVKIFAFFDGYDWFLDTNINATGKEINPDVIGYIFEKYINDRSAMGAYYTKEDITEYIAKNTILPFLFDKVKQDCANAFKSDSGLWQLLKNNPDRYLYEAVKKGCEYYDIPENIAIGIDTDKPDLLARRKDWNTPTPEKFGLPTEIWRETIARRQRYFELKAKLENGGITEINDFITYNLNIRQFAQDALEYYEGFDFVEAFYHAILEITILDPTCGSGAFLFAALNILESLYEACIMRMHEFIAIDDVSKKPPKFKNFREILADIGSHTNPVYWIYKKIILNNLYGVDIMQEAVEIAKLRLFLKLAAMSDVNYQKPNLGLEPLPDIDFNIRCGNTLIGYTTHEQIKKAVEYDVNGQAKLVVDDSMILIDTQVADLQGVLRRYKANQLESNSVGLYEDKQEIKARLAEIQETLDFFLARDYGVDTTDKKKLAQWKHSHQPFHWFTEFFPIVNKGGFDVIIGNPPYVEYSKVKKDYLINNYETESCGNLYIFVLEKTLSIINKSGYYGYILPISFISSDRMKKSQNMMFKFMTWTSGYSNRPAKMFEGVEQRLTIFLAKNIISNDSYSSFYQHWYSDSRKYLLNCIFYIKNTKTEETEKISKIGSCLHESIIKKVYFKTKLIRNYKSQSSNSLVFFHDAPTYWIRSMTFNPYQDYQSERSNHYKSIKLKDSESLDIISCILNSSIFYLYFKTYSNCRDFLLSEVEAFPLGNFLNETVKYLIDCSIKLSNSYLQNRELKTRQYPSGNIDYYEYYPSKSKQIIDDIDKVLAEHYGFTEEELDFIINYEIKYRMGKN
jgi:hypothetical protein